MFGICTKTCCCSTALLSQMPFTSLNYFGGLKTHAKLSSLLALRSCSCSASAENKGNLRKISTHKLTQSLHTDMTYHDMCFVKQSRGEAFHIFHSIVFSISQSCREKALRFTSKSNSTNLCLAAAYAAYCCHLIWTTMHSRGSGVRGSMCCHSSTYVLLMFC